MYPVRERSGAKWPPTPLGRHTLAAIVYPVPQRCNARLECRAQLIERAETASTLSVHGEILPMTFKMSISGLLASLALFSRAQLSRLAVHQALPQETMMKELYRPGLRE